MRLSSASILLGFNTHNGSSVVEYDVDLGVFADLRSGQAGPAFADLFVDRFCGLETLDPIPGGGMPDDFLDRLHAPEGASFAEVLLHASLAVEASTAYAMHRLDGVRFSKIVPGSTPGQVRLVWRCRVPAISRRVARVALKGLAEILPGELRREVDSGRRKFAKAYRNLWRAAARISLSPTTTLLTQAAERRGIPWEQLDGQLIRLGQGAFQRQVWASVTSGTSFLACKFSQHKGRTHAILEDLRLPVPRQIEVKNVDRALAAADRIGYPVVVKPMKGQEGEGVTAGLTDPDGVAAAFRRAKRQRKGVIVESYVEGDDHRFLVMQGRVVAVAKRLPPKVTGDGHRTIRELIAALNTDPLRDDLRRCQVKHDEELDRLLGNTGFELDTVLPEGKEFTLRSTANVSTGGCAIDVTDDVHPDNIEMATRVVQALGLDIAGVDFLTPNIRRSYKKAGGIVEVNSRPGLRPHTWPVEGEPRDVAGTMMAMLFPGRENQGRVPVAVVTGRRGSRPVARILTGILREAGRTVAVASRKGAKVDGDRVAPQGARPSRALRSALRDPRVEVLVRAVSARAIAKRGLELDRCDAVAILDVPTGADVEVHCRGLEIAIRATRGSVIVGAQNQAALDEVHSVDPSRLVLVSRNAGTSAVCAHLETGGKAVVTTRDRGESVIVLLEGFRTVASLPLGSVPTRDNKPSRPDIEAHLFGIALAWSLGLAGKDIQSGLQQDGDGSNLAPERRPSLSDFLS